MMASRYERARDRLGRFCRDCWIFCAVAVLAILLLWLLKEVRGR